MVGNEYEPESPQFSFQAVNDLKPVGLLVLVGQLW